MRDLRELNKLEKYLQKHGYYYRRIDKEPSRPGLLGYDELHQIRVYEDETYNHQLWDVICHRGSYGYTQGLLETMGMPEDGNDVTGYLTADEVIARLEGAL